MYFILVFLFLCLLGSCFESIDSPVFLIPVLLSVVVIVGLLVIGAVIYCSKKSGGYKKGRSYENFTFFMSL